MRANLLSLSISCLILILTFTSCLGDDDEGEYSSDATITSFAIKDIKTVIINGKDTTTFTVKGSNYPFSISQLPSRGSIFNRDSLPVNTDVTKVAFSMSTGGYSSPVSYKYPDKDSLIWLSSTDSVNFTKPIVFTVYAPNGVDKKEYEIDIRVHTTDPDSMIWKKQTDSNFPGEMISKGQKAVIFNNRIYVFAETDAQVKVTSTAMNDGNDWTSLQDISGINGNGDYSSVTVFDNKLYITANGRVYSSENGLEWMDENKEVSSLVAAFSDKMIALDNEMFIDARMDNGVLTWTETGKTKPEKFPLTNYSYVKYPLATYPDIERIIMLGEVLEPTVADSSAVVWSSLSNQDTWVNYPPRATYDCPNLENISLIHYDDQLLAFGGQGFSEDKSIRPFERFYSSTDNGITWHPVKRHLIFPGEFVGRNNQFSYIVDEKQYVWIMWSGENGIWKGRINRLGFENQ